MNIFRWTHLTSFKFRLIWNSCKHLTSLSLNHLMWSCLFASPNMYTCNLHIQKMEIAIPCHFPLYYRFLCVCMYTFSVDSKGLISKGGTGLVGLRTFVLMETSWNQGFLHSIFGLFFRAAHLMSLNSLDALHHSRWLWR